MRTVQDFISTRGIAALLHQPIVETLDENEEIVYISRLCIERDLETWADETKESAARYIHRFYGGTGSCDAERVRWISSNAIILEDCPPAPEAVELAIHYDSRDLAECPHCRRKHYPRGEQLWREKSSRRIFCAECVQNRLADIFAAASEAGK